MLASLWGTIVYLGAHSQSSQADEAIVCSEFQDIEWIRVQDICMGCAPYFSLCFCNLTELVSTCVSLTFQGIFSPESLNPD